MITHCGFSPHAGVAGARETKGLICMGGEDLQVVYVKTENGQPLRSSPHKAKVAG